MQCTNAKLIKGWGNEMTKCAVPETEEVCMDSYKDKMQLNAAQCTRTIVPVGIAASPHEFASTTIKTETLLNYSVAKNNPGLSPV